MPTCVEFQTQLEERFLNELRHHLDGWKDKISNDFSELAYEKELAELESDAVYKDFGFATPQYVLIRLMGRMSISIGRRLGEIYDKIPRFVVQARYGLQREDVAPKFGKLELDVQVPLSKLNQNDREYVKETAANYNLPVSSAGLGIEIRYNFNPNDSARLRKDVDMANELISRDLTPIYLIFSSISPREEAIRRLTKAGWIFLIGETAYSFMEQLANMDISTILQKDNVKREIQNEVNKLMESIFQSYAFNKALQSYL
jgi:hypothetical protein